MPEENDTAVVSVSITPRLCERRGRAGDGASAWGHAERRKKRYGPSSGLCVSPRWNAADGSTFKSNWNVWPPTSGIRAVGQAISGGIWATVVMTCWNVCVRRYCSCVGHGKSQRITVPAPASGGKGLAAMPDDEATTHQRWAHLRFSIVGPLLAAPPARGELQAELERLAAKEWLHPVTGHPARFGISTIQRWYSAQIVLRSQGTIAVEGFLTINNIAGPKSSTNSA